MSSWTNKGLNAMKKPPSAPHPVTRLLTSAFAPVPVPLPSDSFKEAHPRRPVGSGSAPGGLFPLPSNSLPLLRILPSHPRLFHPRPYVLGLSTANLVHLQSWLDTHHLQGVCLFLSLASLGSPIPLSSTCISTRSRPDWLGSPVKPSVCTLRDPTLPPLPGVVIHS
jgi:hypothetical protein